MKLSIIIPTYNEAAGIGKLVTYLRLHAGRHTEIIVADGGSTDGTAAVAKAAGACVLLSDQKGRGTQMNAGAAVAKGDVLYFLHADTFPPEPFEQQIQHALDNGFGSGCFRLRFDEPHWFLTLNAWFTRFSLDAFRFGDQSLFVKRTLFEQAGKFNAQLLLLEDQEIIGRLREKAPFTVLRQQVVTSARKYQQIGKYKLQAGYFLIYGLYRLGVPQHTLVQLYHWLVGK